MPLASHALTLLLDPDGRPERVANPDITTFWGNFRVAGSGITVERL
jgi:hypothetical protein